MSFQIRPETIATVVLSHVDKQILNIIIQCSKLQKKMVNSFEGAFKSLTQFQWLTTFTNKSNLLDIDC